MKPLKDLHEEADSRFRPRVYCRHILLPPDERHTIHRGNERITTYTDGIRYYPSNHYIITHIDWHSLPNDHPLTDGAPRHHHDPNVRKHIREYSRIRGAILHLLIETARTSDYSDTLDELNKHLEDLNLESREAYEAIVDWDGSPHTRLSEPRDSVTRDLRRKAKFEALSMETEWDKWIIKHDVTVITREYIYSHEPERTRYAHGHGGQADLVISIPRDSSLDTSPGVYSPDIKTGQEITHADRMQAEAHRRALSSRSGVEIGGMILHISTEGVDIETHLDDSWPSDALWQAFTQKIDYLYNETLLDVVLQSAVDEHH